VCGADEDTLTLAWEAAERALGAAELAPSAVAGLWWGTTRPPFAEGPSHAFLAAALGLGDGVAGALCAGSPHAGMEALLAAWDSVAAGHAAVALVVVSDALLPGIGTAGEAATGAGAAAYVLVGLTGTEGNGAGAPARLVARTTRSLPVVDRVRGDDEAATGDVYDSRLFREEVFLPLVAQAGEALGRCDRWALADPDGKLAAAAARRLGGALVSSDVSTQLGDCGAAAALLGAASALAGPGSLGIVGYGGGRTTAVAVDVVRAVPGADAVGDTLRGGAAVTYTEALKARGQLRSQTDPIPMGVPPGGAAFVRGNAEMLSLHGARCRVCATVSTPPSIHPHCVGCGSTDLEIVTLARRGTVQTFVVNQTMPPPFTAPLPIVVVDLEDGARLMVQGTSADAAALAVGDEVTLTLRRYATERAVPVYGYKAVRSLGREDAETTKPAVEEVTR
jgi:hydroxymethylglutaryl-CoA synthase